MEKREKGERENTVSCSLPRFEILTICPPTAPFSNNFQNKL
jgi:hypothetical protein